MGSGGVREGAAEPSRRAAGLERSRAPGRRGQRRKLRAGHARRLRLGAVLPRRPPRQQVGPPNRGAAGVVAGSRRARGSAAAGRPSLRGPPPADADTPAGVSRGPQRVPRVTFRPTWLWATAHQNLGGTAQGVPATVSAPDLALRPPRRASAALKVPTVVRAQDTGDVAEPSRTAQLLRGPAGSSGGGRF